MARPSSRYYSSLSRRNRDHSQRFTFIHQSSQGALSTFIACRENADLEYDDVEAD